VLVVDFGDGLEEGTMRRKGAARDVSEGKLLGASPDMLLRGGSAPGMRCDGRPPKPATPPLPLSGDEKSEDNLDGVGKAGALPLGGKKIGPPVDDLNEVTPLRGGGKPPGPRKGEGSPGTRPGIAGKEDLRDGSCGGGMALPDNEFSEGRLAARVPKLAPEILDFEAPPPNLPIVGFFDDETCFGRDVGLGGVTGCGADTNGAALGLNSFAGVGASKGFLLFIAIADGGCTHGESVLLRVISSGKAFGFCSKGSLRRIK